MAKSSEITQINDINKGLTKVNTSINTVVDSYLKLVKTIEDGNKAINKNKISFDGLKTAQKETKNAGEKLNELEKQRINIQKQVQTNETKLNQIRKGEQDQLIKTQQSKAAALKLKKDEIILNDKDAGTLQKLGAQNRILEAEKRKLNLTTEKGRQRLAEINIIQDKNNATIRESSNLLQKQFKNVGNYRNSLEGMTVKIKDLTERQKKLDLSTKEGKKEFKNITAEIDKTKDSLGKLSGTSKESGSSFGGMASPIKTASTSLKAFLANPVVAVLAAIVGAFALFRKALTRSEEGQDRLNKISRFFGSILDNLLDVITNIGVFLIDAFTKPKEALNRFKDLLVQNIVNRFKGIIEAAGNLGTIFTKLFKGQFKEAGDAAKELGQNLIQVATGLDETQQAGIVNGLRNIGKELSEDAKKASELADIEAKYNKDEREALIQNAILAKKSAQLRGEAEALKKLDAESAIESLEKSFALDEKILANDLSMARTRAEILRKQSALASDTIEDKKAIAEAEAEVFNVETRFNDLRRQRTRRLNSLRMEGLKQETDRAKSLLEIETSNTAERIKLNNILFADVSKTNQQRINAAVDTAEALTELANNGFEIEMKRLQAELDLKLKSEEDYNIELLALQSKRDSAIAIANGDAVKKQEELARKTADSISKAAIAESNRQLEIDMLLAEATIKNKEDLNDRIFELNRDALENQLTSIQELLDAEVEGSERKLQLEQEYADKEAEIQAADLENKIAKTESEIELEERKRQAKLETLDIIKSIFGEESAIGKAAIVAQKVIALKETFLAQKKIFENQAVAQSKAAATSPPPFNIPFILASIAQFVSIFSLFKKAPKFFKGTDNAPDKFIAGDSASGNASRELMFLRDGSAMMVNEPTYFEGNKFKGATIKTNTETERIIKGSAGMDGSIDGRLLSEMRGVKQAIISKPVMILDERGKVIGYKQNNHITTYVNRLKYGD